MTARVRHISLDVWNTLIVSNPKFGPARMRFLAAELSMPLEEVEKVYRRCKDGADHAAETQGAGASSAEVFDHFVQELGRPEYNWWSLRQGMERLFAKYPPLIPDESIQALRAVQAAGLSLSIGSNTNFIRGEVLHDVALSQWGVTWEFQVFSDQISRSKPHPFFWKVVKERALTHVGAKAGEILHIGDHKICDGGCQNHGIQFAHIKGPADLAQALGATLHAQAA